VICQSCNQKDASVHITKVVNGVKSDMHLCEECARQSQELNINPAFTFGVPLSLQNLMDGFFESMTSPHKKIVHETVCPVCNKTFSDFRRSGRLGCGSCYKSFKDNMTSLVRRIHGNIEHTGKVPKRTGGVLKIRREVESLKEQLQLLVANEEFEKAAKLRDEIRELESKINESGK
jgi:protein arginine kinase activator